MLSETVNNNHNDMSSAAIRENSVLPVDVSNKTEIVTAIVTGKWK